MSQAYHVGHASNFSPGDPAPYPPPQAPGPPPPPPPPVHPPRAGRGYQGYFSGGGGYPPPSATPPPLRPYHHYHDRYGLGCSSLLRGCPIRLKIAYYILKQQVSKELNQTPWSVVGE